jgi:hypothetical protein
MEVNMCEVVNKYKEEYDVYIGRGSIWGNPYVMKDNSDTARDTVIEQYRKHLINQLKTGEITIEQLRALDGKKLGCFCKPKNCHGDVIVRAVKWALTHDSFNYVW